VGFMMYLRAQWDRAGAVVAAVGGLVVLMLGWVGTSGTGYLAKQIPYLISGGLLGIFLLGVASVLWLSADMRDEWRQLRAIEEALRSGSAERIAFSDGEVMSGEVEPAQEIMFQASP
jgi:hypothetical protein